MSGGRRGELYERIYRLVREIPAGRVATYGQIAKMVGSGPRQVGYAMAALPSRSGVPWHRVINAQGGISPRKEGDSGARQRTRLRAEGLRFDRRGRMDLAATRWAGPSWAWLAAHGYEVPL